MDRFVTRKQRFDHKLNLTEKDNKDSLDGSICFEWDKVRGVRKARGKTDGFDQPSRTESIQYRNGNVVSIDILKDPHDYSPNKSIDSGGDIDTKSSKIIDFQRSTEKSQQKSQKTTHVLTATLDGETESLNSNTTHLTHSSFEPSIPIKLKSAKLSREERLLCHPINYIRAVPDLEILSDYTPGTKEVKRVFSKIQSIPKREDTVEYRTIHQKDAYKTGDGGQDNPNNSSSNNNNQRAGKPLRLLCNLKDMPSTLVVASVQSDSIKGVSAKCVDHLRSNAHWYEVSSPIQQAQLSSLSQMSGSPESRTRTSSTSAEFKQNLSGDALSQSYHGSTSRRRQNHLTQLQEYKIPERLGASRVCDGSSQLTQQETVIRGNGVDYYNSNDKNENVSVTDCIFSSGVNGSKSAPQPSYKKEKRCWDASCSSTEKRKPCRKIDHFVDMEYYDINSDQELNSLMSRRRAKSLYDCELVTDVGTQAKGVPARSEDACFAAITGRDLIEEDIPGLQAQLKPSFGTMMSWHSTEFPKTNHRSFYCRPFDKSNGGDKDDHQATKLDHLIQKKIETNGYLFKRESSSDVEKGYRENKASSPWPFEKNNLLNVKDCSGNHRRIDDQFPRDDCSIKLKANPYYRTSNPDEGCSHEIINELLNDSFKSPWKTSVIEQYFPSGATKQAANASTMYKDHGSNGCVERKANWMCTKDDAVLSSQKNFKIPETKPCVENQRYSEPTCNTPIKTTNKDKTFTGTSYNSNIGNERNPKNAQSNDIDLNLTSLVRQDKRSSICSVDSSHVTTDSYDNDSNVEHDENLTGIQSKEEFKTTLKQLSRYVLAGYKETVKKSERIRNTQDMNAVTTNINKQRYHLDDEEGELSDVKEQYDGFKRLSMVVNTLTRLREMYTIVFLPTLPYRDTFKKSKVPGKLRNLGDDRGNNLLRDAIENRSMSEVKKVVLNHLDVDINLLSQSGYSCLHRAAEEGDIEGLRILIEHYADLDVSDRSGFPPVHNALKCYHYKAAMFLMDCGTDLMSYTSKRIQEFVKVKATAKQYLKQNLKTRL